MKPDPELQKLLRNAFKVELDDTLQTLSQGLLDLEREAASGERRGCLERLFRAAHSIKGAARAADMPVVGALAHELESLFAVLRKHDAAPAPESIDNCLKAVDAMRNAAAALVANQPAGDQAEAVLDELKASTVRQTAAAAAGAPREEATPAPAPAAVSKLPSPDIPVVHVGIDRLNRIDTLTGGLRMAWGEMGELAKELRRLHDRIAALATTCASTVLHMESARDQPLLNETRTLFAEQHDELTRIGLDLHRLHAVLRSSSVRERAVATQAQDEARLLRLVPADRALQPLARTVRDMARELGKTAHLRMGGESIEMDRAVLDAVRPALIQLLRNAIDHGIETPDVRRERGKPEAGEISIDLARDGGRVRLTVTDDGAGMGGREIAAAAIQRGELTADELADMPRRDILDLIFRPGFSTRQEVTSLSGRGFGLDLVRTRLQQLKGSIAFDSREGHGSRFTLLLPRTLTAQRGLLVKVGSNVLALPTAQVERVVLLTAANVLEARNTQMIVLAGASLPVHDLGRVLGIEGHAPDRDASVLAVVVRVDRQAVALRVDDVLGERELVVKPLRAPLQSLPHVSGGTLIAAGEIVLMLSPTPLVRSALAGPQTLRWSEPDARPQAARHARHVLVADDSFTSRTLERNVLEHHGYEVTTVGDGAGAWELLRERVFDLVISDIDMPELDGIELTRRLRAQARSKDTPVVLVTSLDDEDHKRRGLEAGADAYVVKADLTSAGLLEVVERLIGAPARDKEPLG